MSEGLIIELMQLLLKTAAMLTAPIIGATLFVGLFSQILQTVTQMRDQSLNFVPKVVVAGIIFAAGIPWYIQIVKEFTEFIFMLIGNGGGV